ncbi:MAG: DUF4185 domain-containing protein, partial [Propionibacteriales bacterium]|nr:DUF4185 domain-containing protein [Propionibacteriales bacterium]
MPVEPLIGTGSAVLGPGRGRRRSLEAAVLNGGRLDHYRRLIDRPDRWWVHAGVISEDAVAPAALALIEAALYARVVESGGERTYRFFDTGWQAADAPTTWPSSRPEPPPREALGLAEGSVAVVCAFDADWPQALVEIDGSLYGYQQRPDGHWRRASCLQVAAEPFVEATFSSTRLAQVTGELDATATPWGERVPTLSRSQSSAGIRGTDLGVLFQHDGRQFLLFGDTHWGRPWLALRDSIAEVVTDSGLPEVTFHGSPLRLRGGRATMGEYDVPLDAASVDGQLYGFFSSNHGRNRQVMGRSVVARCVDPHLPIDPDRRHRPIRFDVLGTLSELHFINVSAQLRPASAVPGAGGEGEVLLLWGTGSYRSSEVRLAMLDAAALARLAALRAPVATAELGLRYWDGHGWSGEEADAAPLFSPGAYGELSVRWVAEVGRYALLLASGPGDAAGTAITLRWADHPQGPWTPRRRLWDWVAQGMSSDPFTRFIKSSPDDAVAEAIFPAQ